MVAKGDAWFREVIAKAHSEGSSIPYKYDGMNPGKFAALERRHIREERAVGLSRNPYIRGKTEKKAV